MSRFGRDRRAVARFGSAGPVLLGRPGPAREQRILAIRSLGVLGRPEALPFLIEWTTDPDQEIAVQANTAITSLHLGAKK